MTEDMPVPVRPRVSVVMANHNGAEHVEAAMRSVLRQSLTDLELIVVDDASTDDSLARIEKVAAGDARVRIIGSALNGGPGTARNLALDVAAGEWVSVIDSDDLFHPSRLERLVACAGETGCDVIADDLIHFTTEGPAPPERLFSGSRLEQATVVSLSDLLADRFAGAPNRLGYLKPVIRRAALGDLRYREDLRVGEDFDLLLRLVAAGAALNVLPDALYLYRRHRASVSHRLAARDARAMVDALLDFQSMAGPLPPTASRNLSLRIAAMKVGARDAYAIEAFKARRPAAAARFIARYPDRIPAVAGQVARVARSRLRRRAEAAPLQPLLLLAPGARPLDVPASWEALALPPAPEMSPDDAARLTAATADGTRTLFVHGQLDPAAIGFIPEPDRLAAVSDNAGKSPLVHVRTPTYKRPEMLRRALKGLQAQTVQDWVCDVYDDDPDRSGETVVAALGDPRIRYAANRPARRASRNIDLCFTRYNPHGARYFFVIEDDNQVLPRFIEDNIAISEDTGARIVLRNQLVEHRSGTPEARLGTTGLLDTKLSGGFCEADVLHMSLMADMGVSNGGLFWSRDAESDLEIGMPCSATLQEYLRTLAIVEPVYVALEPLAIWAENGENTVRDLGETAAWFRREIDLKRSVQYLQRVVWKRARPDARRSYLDDPAFRYPASMRATGLVKSLSRPWAGRALAPRETVRLLLRGIAIRLIGRPSRGLDRFVSDRRIRRHDPATPLSP